MNSVRSSFYLRTLWWHFLDIAQIRIVALPINGITEDLPVTRPCSCDVFLVISETSILLPSAEIIVE